MAISIDYLTSTIFVPRADLVEIQSTPSYIYQMNLEWFYRQVTDLQDDQAGSPYVDAVQNTAPVNVGGVTLARVIQVINGFSVEFEDGQYAVNLTGSNTNLQDVAVVNQVSIRPNNSAGLQDLSTLLQASYGGVVCVDVVNGQAGTVIPLGTRGLPVNNFADAKVIADSNSLLGIQIMRSCTLDSTDFSDGHVFIGDNSATVVLTIDTTSNTQNCTFQNLTVTGVLDGANTFRECLIQDITYTNGFIFQCALNGTITLGGGAQCSILDCWSNIPGGGPGAYPIVDMGGSGNSLALRNYSGGIGLRNYSGSGAVSVDMASGRVVVESTVTAGEIAIRGIADITDNSTGTAVVVDATVNQTLDLIVTGQGIIETIVTFIRKLLGNKVTVAPDDSTTTIYDDDKTTPILVFDHADARNRDPQ
jgi:hypothetical protein